MANAAARARGRRGDWRVNRWKKTVVRTQNIYIPAAGFERIFLINYNKNIIFF